MATIFLEEAYNTKLIVTVKAVFVFGYTSASTISVYTSNTDNRTTRHRNKFIGVEPAECYYHL